MRGSASCAASSFSLQIVINASPIIRYHSLDQRIFTKEKMEPKVTIGIPTYSRLPYLKEAVASSIAQTHPNIEIFISQNPHSDRRVPEEIADYCSSLRDSRIRYQLQARNLGQQPNHN